MGPWGSAVVWAALVVLCAVVLCQAPPPRPDAGRGALAFRKGMCTTCHWMGDSGGSNAPDLTTVGKKYIELRGGREQARDWFRHHLMAPDLYPGTTKATTHWPSSMPSFQYVFAPRELDDLVEFLLSCQ